MKFLKVLNNKKLFFILIGILVILHLMAFAYRAHIGPAETIDSKAYFLCAQNASEGLGFQGNAPNEPYTEEDVTIRPIGYPAIILLLGKSKIAVMGIQILFSLSTIIVCLIFLRKKGFSILSQNILLFGFLFTPSQILYATTLMTEIPFQFFLTVSFLSIALFIEQ